MSKLVLSTKTSLYDPIEIELDGQTYPVNPTSEVMKRITETLKDPEKVKEDPCTALIGQLVIYTGAKKEILDKLDVRDLKKAISFITEQLAVTMVPGESEAKNESKPAETK